MAKLNIAERRLPQDGRIRLAVQGQEFDLRVSTMPTLHGESVVMRILDRASLVQDLAGARLPRGDARSPSSSVLDQPQGILLVTGPTGSGKTTTLYTCLMRLNSPERKLFTVEDPIEYQLDGVNQIQVKPQIGLTFAQVLRSILRQDPDIIMVGEMRDLETAQIAVQAALTGHLVLSTLHTNSAAGTVTRLLDMGVEDYLVTSTVNGVLAQRLVRKLCDALPRALCSPCPSWRRSFACPQAGRAADALSRRAAASAASGSAISAAIAVLEFLRAHRTRSAGSCSPRRRPSEIHRAAVGRGHALDVRGRHAQGAAGHHLDRRSAARHAGRLRT